MIQLFKSSKRTATKKKNVIVSLLLVAALAITGALAYLTATDSAENKFTVGNVDISLAEPEWDKANPDGTLENIVAGQVITKDPTVTNTGTNDAYAYIMVEIPKVYSTDIVSTDAEGNTVTTSESHYPLFSFEANDGWTLIDSQTGTETDAYDYHLYAYDTALAPNSAATLFNKVTFANITEDFVNSITGEEIVDLAINITGYAIQSDYYNNEASDVSSAWELYAIQNNWAWPDKPYEGLVKVNYLNENDELVNTDVVYAGAPVTMYFEPSLAKTGYTFDWVDETTGETAYSGMTVEEDTTLTATYTDTGYSADEMSGLIKYRLYGNNADGYTAEIYGVNSATLETWVLPTSVTITGDGKKDNTDTLKYGLTGDAYCITYAYGAEAVNGTYEIPVTKVSAYSSVPKQIIFPDSASSVAITGCYGLESLTLPYAVTSLNVNNTTDGDNYAIKEVILPNSLTSLSRNAFYGFQHIEEITIPGSLKVIPVNAFYNCANLKKIIIEEGVEVISAGAFDHTTRTGSTDDIEKEITIPSTVKEISQTAFEYTVNRSFWSVVNYNAIDCKVVSSTGVVTDSNPFYDSVKTLNIGSDVKVIPAGLFRGIEATNVYIPDNVQVIEANAFINSELTSASVPSDCVVGENAFPSTCTVTYR